MCLICWNGWASKDMLSATSIGFSPLVPWFVIIAAAILGLLLVGAQFFARQKGAVLRACAFGLLCLALANPSIINEERDRLKDVVVVAVDRSGSQAIDQRSVQTDQAVAEVKRQLEARNGTEIRMLEVLERPDAADGTRLFDALVQGVGDVPADRLSGIIAITDGQVHDVPPSLKALGFGAPFHALITGRQDERDRRIELSESPRFGIVGKEQTIAFRILDTVEGPVPYSIRVDGVPLTSAVAAAGEVVRLPVKIEHAGQNLIEIEAEVATDELTPVNNTAIISVEGIRDKLRVLLVSGAPNAGERTWRNLLKADANVELVHFTILRPPEKQDGTPINELSLIAFPTRELFQQKISEFNLIIFDRYANQSTILPDVYFENIAEYVRNGGALLIAAGPEYGQQGGLQETPLRAILPAQTTGTMLEDPFLPRVSVIGERHPVTRKLPGATGDQPSWAPWFRMVAANATTGATVMSDASANPLLVLSREEKGRVGLFLSDQFWLWARGFGNGGPHLDLLRRLSHWLMKEPDLEEEALRMTAQGRIITIERRTLAEKTDDVTFISPDGQTLPISLTEAEPGLWRATVTARRVGLHKAVQGELNAFVNIGPANPREFRDVLSSMDIVKPVANETGGAVIRLASGGGVSVPRIVDIRTGSSFAGSGYIGLKPTEAHTVRGVGLFPIAAGLTGLLLLLAATIITWLREGRGFRARKAA
jgi:hypothetical protein